MRTAELLFLITNREMVEKKKKKKKKKKNKAWELAFRVVMKRLGGTIRQQWQVGRVHMTRDSGRSRR
jgi:hypothetical protein